MIRRGSTPSYKITVSSSDGTTPVSQLMELIEDFYITFQQTRQGNSITKHGDDLSWEEDGVAFYLTQEDTLSLSAGTCEIQVRLNLIGDKAMASSIAEEDVEKVLYEVVI